MMQITPVASASPNGNVRIARRFRGMAYNPKILEQTEAAEEWARFQQIDQQDAKEYVRWHNFLAALAADDISGFNEEFETANCIGSRRAAMEENGWGEIFIRPGWGRSARSRSHSRSKAAKRWGQTF